MLLKGSCHCGGVQFQLTSKHPYPFNFCYCSICRKTQGAGGFAINLSGDADSLEITGEENRTIYQAKVPDGETGDLKPSPARRHFAKFAAAIYGSSILGGLSLCTLLHRPLIQICPSRLKERT